MWPMLAVYFLVGLATVIILRKAYIAYIPGFYVTNFKLIYLLGITAWPLIWLILAVDVCFVIAIRKYQKHSSK